MSRGRRSVKKITLYTCALILVELLAPVGIWTLSAAPGSQITAVAYPKDAAFLFDQLDVELTIPSPSPKSPPHQFRTIARPGQFLMVGLPVPGDEKLIRQFAFIIQPEIDGEMVIDHSKLNGVAKQRLTFNILPFCLEETPASTQPEELARHSGCNPRDRNAKQSDDVFDFEPLDRVGFNQPVPEPNSGITLKITQYRQNIMNRPEDLGSFARACLDVDGISVCSCKVSHGAKSSAAGCL